MKKSFLILVISVVHISCASSSITSSLSSSMLEPSSNVVSMSSHISSITLSSGGLPLDASIGTSSSTNITAVSPGSSADLQTTTIPISQTLNLLSTSQLSGYSTISGYSSSYTTTLSESLKMNNTVVINSNVQSTAIITSELSNSTMSSLEIHPSSSVISNSLIQPITLNASEFQTMSNNTVSLSTIETSSISSSISSTTSTLLDSLNVSTTIVLSKIMTGAPPVSEISSPTLGMVATSTSLLKITNTVDTEIVPSVSQPASTMNIDIKSSIIETSTSLGTVVDVSPSTSTINATDSTIPSISNNSVDLYSTTNVSVSIPNSIRPSSIYFDSTPTVNTLTPSLTSLPTSSNKQVYSENFIVSIMTILNENSTEGTHISTTARSFPHASSTGMILPSSAGLTTGLSDHINSTVSGSKSFTSVLIVSTSVVQTGLSVNYTTIQIVHASISSLQLNTIPLHSISPSSVSSIVNSITASEAIQSSIKTNPSASVPYSIATTPVTEKVTPLCSRTRFMMTFQGECERLADNEHLQLEFWKSLLAVINTTTYTSTSVSYDDIETTDFNCDPFQVVLIYTNVVKDEFISRINVSIYNSSFEVPIIDDNTVLKYKAVSVQQLPMAYDINDTRSNLRTGLEQIDILIIVIAAFLFALLLLIGGVILCRECYKRKRSASFSLLDVPHVNLKLSDFTLTRIPRPQMIYNQNGSSSNGNDVSNGRTKHKIMKQSENNIESEKMAVDAENIHVRMRDHEDGLVVSVTCSPSHASPTSTSSSSSSPTNTVSSQSKQSLLKREKPDECAGTTNPNFTIGEDASRVLIQDDENEQLL